jgi:outer membrane biosynthesis protein TonB
MPLFLHALFLTLVIALFSSTTASGAALASADLNDGYSGKVLDKVCQVWAPPPALKGDFKVHLTVSLDEQGKVVNCVPSKSSGMEALDISACGAVRQVGNFGTPPYNAPLDVYLTFWTGVPKGKAKAITPTSEEAMRAEVMARTKAEQLMREQQADAAEERAKERARSVAEASGRELPDVRPAPVAPPARTTAASPEADKKKDAKKRKDTPDAESDSKKPESPGAAKPVTNEKKLPDGKATSMPAAAPTTEKPQRQSPAARSGAGLTDEEMRLTMPPTPDAAPQANTRTPANTGAGAPHEKYLRNVTWDLRTAIIIPAETPPGEYYPVVRLRVDAGGAIKKCDLAKSSGDALLDKYTLRGIGKLGHVRPPPAGFGDTLELTLKLVRR